MQLLLLATLLSTALAADCWGANVDPQWQTDLDEGRINEIADAFCGGLPGSDFVHLDYHGKTIELSFTLNGANNFGHCPAAVRDIFNQCGVVGGHWELEGQFYRTDLK